MSQRQAISLTCMQRAVPSLEDALPAQISLSALQEGLSFLVPVPRSRRRGFVAEGRQCFWSPALRKAE